MKPLVIIFLLLNEVFIEVTTLSEVPINYLSSNEEHQESITMSQSQSPVSSEDHQSPQDGSITQSVDSSSESTNSLSENKAFSTETTTSPLMDMITVFHSVVSGKIDPSNVVSNIKDIITVAGTTTEPSPHTVSNIDSSDTFSHGPSSVLELTESSTSAEAHSTTSDRLSLPKVETKIINKKPTQLLEAIANETSTVNKERDTIELNVSPTTTDIPVYEIDILELEMHNLGESNQDVPIQQHVLGVLNPVQDGQQNYEAYWPGLFENENNKGLPETYPYHYNNNKAAHLNRPPYDALPFDIPYDKQPILPTKLPELEDHPGEEGVIVYIPPGAVIPNIYLGRPVQYHYNSVHQQHPTVSAPSGYPILSAALFWSKNLSNWFVNLTGIGVIILTLYKVSIRLLGYKTSSRMRRSVPSNEESLEDIVALLSKALSSQRFQ